MSAQKYIRLMDAAEEYGIARQKLWQLVKDGKLTAYGDIRDGRARLLKRSDLEALLQPYPLEPEEGRSDPER